MTTTILDITLTAGTVTVVPLREVPAHPHWVGAWVSHREAPSPGVMPGSRRIRGARLKGVGHIEPGGEWAAFIEYDGSETNEAGFPMPTLDATATVYEV